MDYAVLHPAGKVTVKIDGHPFGSRQRAQQEARQFDDSECDECGEPAHGRRHGIVERQVGEWTGSPDEHA